jgi:type II secretory pathway pseudopilin PulG
LHRTGFILMGLLVVLALAGIALTGAVNFWTLQRQREREQELLFVGNAYREAVRSYYFGAPPGSARTLPPRLEVLLDDDRYPMPVHHLRRRYPDPVSDGAEWGELRVGNAIAGVYSRSQGQPLKQAGFAAADAGFAGKARYRDWVFYFAPPPDATLSTRSALGNTP